MPLEENLRKKVIDYCIRDLPADLNWHFCQFSFIDDIKLQRKLGQVYYSARFISKVMEALYVDAENMYPFVKYQIIQYASIYEAVITNLLWNKFKDHHEVLSLQTHKSYKPVSALGNKCNITYEGEKLYTCLYKDSKTHRNSIPFKDKVDCAVRIGFVEERYSEEIKHIYKLRNLSHIETEAKSFLELELEDSKKSYWRMKPFLEKINDFISN